MEALSPIAEGNRFNLELISPSGAKHIFLFKMPDSQLTALPEFRSAKYSSSLTLGAPSLFH